MKQQLNPVVLIVIGVVLIGILAFFFNRSVNPHPPAPTISTGLMDQEGPAAKRERYAKMHGGQLPGAPAAPPASSGAGN